MRNRADQFSNTLIGSDNILSCHWSVLSLFVKADCRREIYKRSRIILLVWRIWLPFSRRNSYSFSRSWSQYASHFTIVIKKITDRKAAKSFRSAFFPLRWLSRIFSSFNRTYSVMHYSFSYQVCYFFR